MRRWLRRRGEQLARVPGRVLRVMLTALAAILYTLSYAAGFTLRTVVTIATWTAATVTLGWHDAWPPPPPPRNPEYGPPRPPMRVRRK